MKARTNYEREAVRLQRRLPALTDAQIKWIVGREQKETLDAFEKNHRKVSMNNYYSIVTTMEGWQVIRYALAHSERSRNGFKQCYITEVSQRWMRLKETAGAELVVFEKAYNMCWYNHYQPYLLGSELTIKPWGGSYTRHCITAMHMGEDECYPIRRYSDQFKDTLLAEHLIGRYDEIELYEDALRDWHKEDGKHILSPIVETLYEMGEPDLAEWMVWKSGWKQQDLIKYWPSFLIARRNGLRCTLGGWQDWIDYVADLDRLGRDVRSPRYLVPEEGVQKAHEMVMRQIERKEERERKKKEAEEAPNVIAEWDGKYKERMEGYFGLSFHTASGLTITPLQSVQAFWDEYQAMHHCVWTCAYYANETSLVLSARDADGKRVETIDVDLTKLVVTQSRGVCNKPTAYHKEILETMQNNMWQIGQIVPKVARIAS